MAFPNVPNVPGVPALPRDPLAIIPALTLLFTDLVSLIAGPLNSRWGVYLNGQRVIIADIVVTLDYRNDQSVPDYQLESGAFSNYDKVATPFDIRLRVASGGNVSNRQQLIASCEAAVKSLDLYDVVTPERIYQSVNIIHMDYDRSARKGLGLLQIDIWGKQIRVASEPAFLSTITPQGTGPIGAGLVQPTPATPNQQAQAPLVQ